MGSPKFYDNWTFAWRCQLAPLLGGRPCNVPMHINLRERTVPRVFIPTTSERLVSQASPGKSVAFRPISILDRKADTSGVRRNGQKGIHVKACRLASEKYRTGPNNGLRSNLIPPKFHIFSGGACWPRKPHPSKGVACETRKHAIRSP